MPNDSETLLGTGVALRGALAGKRVVVTGGAGAIGSNLSAALCGAGCEVVVVDDFSSGYRANLEALAGRIRLVEGDLAEEATLAEAFAKPVALIFHLAAFFANQNSVDHPHADLRTNGQATLSLVQRAAALGVERFVFASSSCVYGSQGGALGEGSPLQPETPYGITKILGEQYCEFFGCHAGLSWAIVRYFNSYGPGEYPGRYRNVIPNFFAQAMIGRPLVITGTGEETRDFTFVGDIVRGTLLAGITPGAAGQILNLGTGRETTIRELAEEINQLCGNLAGVEYRPRREWDHVNRRRADITRARELLGYAPETPLRSGLCRTHHWFCARHTGRQPATPALARLVETALG
ncbi:MAG: NAD-dependent epimerase/dehydratase family protein [Candidatus Handelsmanbacteria bacterium]|nr:NAD-dependent epimerase/dehydratase family protein [Candidatus Handelsmanbacteria bacterium]